MKNQTRTAIILGSLLFFGAPMAFTLGMGFGTLSAIPEVKRLSKVAIATEQQLQKVNQQISERNKEK